LPPPDIRTNGWWCVPEQPAGPDNAVDGEEIGTPALDGGYPSLGADADSTGLVPIVVRMDNGRAVVGRVRLSAVEFAEDIRSQPQWGHRDLMIFASGAGTRARVDGVRQERSFARQLRDELGVAIVVPRGHLVHCGGTTWVSSGAVGAGKSPWPHLSRRSRHTGFKHYPRVGHGYHRLPGQGDALPEPP